MNPRVVAVVALVGSAATVPLLVATTWAGLEGLIVPIFLLTLVVAEAARRCAASFPRLVLLLALVGAVLAVVSILTGWLNGFSDEPYTTPAYAALGWNLYTQPIHIVYLQYGVAHTETSFYVYLPLLTYLQVPGLDYRWVALGAWGAALCLLRRRPFAAAGFSAAWIPLLAANGQNDFVPLLALTVALALPTLRNRFWAEVVALAVKQPANIVVFFYHLLRREYLRAVAAIAITVAILAPFLYLAPGAVVCHVLVGDPGTTCAGHPWTFFVFKRNYWLYPAWAAVVFGPAVWASRRRWRPGTAPAAPERAPT